MTKLVILGTAWVIPDKKHENTHMIVKGDDGCVLIDSGANPIISLDRAGVDPDRLEALVVTHFHPDHISGVPMLLLNLWLIGRQQPLSVHGLRATLDKVEALMTLYEWTEWPQFYPVTFEKVSASGESLVLETTDVRILATSTHHLVPSIALKVISRATGRSIAYSSDTSPCDALVRLARGADLLLHEASGATAGHSSPAMAGAIARLAGVGRLALIHYDVKASPDELIDEAHSTFDGPVTVTQDLEEFDF